DSARGLRSRGSPPQRAAPRRRLRVQPHARHAVRDAPPLAARALEVAVHAAVDLTSGTLKWNVPLGSFAGTLTPEAAARLPAGLGSPNLGGPIVTAGG